ncbi:MAG TPA: sigma factor, partial [Edaphobacter sp.]|nr:sigma factor [Edaphobacter sp.]
YLIALSFMKSEADAEDIAQEAFLKAFRHLSTFRDEFKFSTLAHQHHTQRSEKPASATDDRSHAIA